MWGPRPGQGVDGEGQVGGSLPPPGCHWCPSGQPPPPTSNAPPSRASRRPTQPLPHAAPARLQVAGEWGGQRGRAPIFLPALCRSSCKFKFRHISVHRLETACPLPLPPTVPDEMGQRQNGRVLGPLASSGSLPLPLWPALSLALSRYMWELFGPPQGWQWLCWTSPGPQPQSGALRQWVTGLCSCLSRALLCRRPARAPVFLGDSHLSWPPPITPSPVTLRA